MTKARGEIARGLFSLVFFAAVVLIVWPLCTPGYLPIEDLPQHLAAVRVLHSYHDPQFGFARYFELDLFRTQYLAYYLLADGLAYVLDLELGNRLLIIACAAATPYALRYLLRALERDQWPALFALPLTYNAHLILGFVNFLMAIPLALLGLGLAVRQRNAPTRMRGVALACTAVICFFSHVVPFALFALGCVLIAADTKPLATWKRLVPLAPAGLASLFWLFASPAGRATMRAAHGGTGGPQPLYQTASFSRQDMPNWLTDTFHGDDDALVLRGCALVLCLTLVLGFAAAVRSFMLARSQRARAEGTASALWSGEIRSALWSGAIRSAFARGLPPYLRILPLAPLSLLLYFVTPTAYDWIWPIAQRFPLLAVLFLIPVLPAPPRAATVVLACALLWLTFAQEQIAARAFAQFAADEVGDFDRALAAIPARKRVLGLIYSRGSRHVKFAPFIHYVAYYQVRKGGAVMFTFADFPQSPFRFREADRPPRVPPRWEWLPHLVRPSDLAWYEYVLVRAGPSPCAGTCELTYGGTMWSVWKTR